MKQLTPSHNDEHDDGDNLQGADPEFDFSEKPYGKCLYSESDDNENGDPERCQVLRGIPIANKNGKCSCLGAKDGDPGKPILPTGSKPQTGVIESGGVSGKATRDG